MAFVKGQARAIIETELANVPELNELESNGSRAGWWSYIKDAYDYLCVEISTLFEKHKQEVNELVQTQEPALRQWWVDLVKKYQHGDTITLSNNIVTYNLIDAAKQIVKYVNIDEVEKNVAGSDKLLVSIKAAKEGGSGIEPLDAVEQAGLTSYLNKTKPMGIRFELISLPHALVSYTLTIERDPAVLNAAGERIDGTEDTPVLSALEAYHESKNENEFSGKLYLTKVTDALQEIDGVIDPEITEARLWNGSAFVPFDRVLESEAGYELVDEASLIINYV